jgi:transposase InsO family protein
VKKEGSLGVTMQLHPHRGQQKPVVCHQSRQGTFRKSPEPDLPMELFDRIYASVNALWAGSQTTASTMGHSALAPERPPDARIAVAALKAAIRNRAPPKGCIHHSDRGSQYASEVYRTLLAAHGLTGSMSRRGNPYNNAKAESFMKTLKVEAVYLAAYENL